MRVTRPTARPAFTLTEMMVATALLLFLMLVISQAFGGATKTFSTMRTAGQLQERLRGGITVFRRDLAHDHYGPPYTTYSGPKVANQLMHLPGWTPPEGGGYMEINQFGVFAGTEYKGSCMGEPYLSPVTDGELLYSTRAAPNPDPSQPNLNRPNALRFTVRVPVGAPNELYCAEFEPSALLLNNRDAAGNRYQVNDFPDPSRSVIYSRWMEVTYFMQATGETAGNNGVPTFALYRKVRVLAPKGVTIPYDDTTLFPPFAGKTPAALMAAKYPDVAIEQPAPGFFRILGPDDVTNVARRISPTPATKLNTNTGVTSVTGGDILMTDVISFSVKAAWIRNPNLNVPGNGANDYAGTSPDPAAFAGTSLGATHPWLFTDGPFYDLTRSPVNPTYERQGRFDTWGPVQTITNPQPPLTAAGTYAAGDYVNWDDPQSFLPTTDPNVPRQLLPPLRINVRAVQIQIRIWDPRAGQARQVTIVQEV